MPFYPPRQKVREPDYKKTSVELRRLFETVAVDHRIDVDRLLARGIFLATIELIGRESFQMDLNSWKSDPDRKEFTFDETIVVDEETWFGRSALIQWGRYGNDHVHNPDWTPEQK